ncbi:MAG TPA: type II toxin-antitoxin system VapC family toxin [Rhizomicrobium sp.]
MIVVDTSAPVAIILGEPAGRACLAVLERESEILISAATLAELLVVAARRQIAGEIGKLIDSVGFETVTLTKSAAVAVGDAYRKWGKGFHPAGLNFGDCFAYVLAKESGCALLFVGDDFSRTDVASAL